MTTRAIFVFFPKRNKLSLRAAVPCWKHPSLLKKMSRKEIKYSFSLRGLSDDVDQATLSNFFVTQGAAVASIRMVPGGAYVNLSAGNLSQVIFGYHIIGSFTVGSFTEQNYARLS